MILKSDIDRPGAMLRGHNARYIDILRNSAGPLNPAPALTAVFGHLHQPVVGARVNEFLLFRRFRDSRNTGAYSDAGRSRAAHPSSSAWAGRLWQAEAGYPPSHRYADRSAPDHHSAWSRTRYWSPWDPPGYRSRHRRA